jgi:hypothetical protein
MICIVVNKGEPQEKAHQMDLERMQVLPCEKIDNGATFACKQPNGKIYTITPEGHTEERDEFINGVPSAAQPWQQFKFVPGLLIAERVRNVNGVDTTVVYQRLASEVK